MKNKYRYIVPSIIVLIITVSFFIFFNKKNHKEIKPILTKSELALDIVSKTASTSDPNILFKLKSTTIIIPNTDNTPLTLGDIVLSKDFNGNTDIVGYGYTTNTKSKKVIYILLWRKNIDEYKLVSSSQVEQAKDIIGIRAADASNSSGYYIDIQFTPIGDTNETQGVIKSVDSKGIL